MSADEFEGALIELAGGLEFRVRWQREGQRPRVALFQSERWALRKIDQLLGKIDPWDGQDLDAYECCPGTRTYECGCGGMTKREAREAWLRQYDMVPPFVVEPFMEKRPVGVWGAVS